MDGLVDCLGTGRRVILVRLRLWFVHGPRKVDQLTDLRQRIGLGAAAREQSVVADAMEALRQNVQHEPPDELAWGHSHGLIPAGPLAPVVLILECDALLVGADQSARGNGNAVRVASEIGQYLLGSGEGALGIDMPLRYRSARRRALSATRWRGSP